MRSRPRSARCPIPSCTRATISQRTRRMPLDVGTGLSHTQGTVRCLLSDGRVPSTLKSKKAKKNPCDQACVERAPHSPFVRRKCFFFFFFSTAHDRISPPCIVSAPCAPSRPCPDVGCQVQETVREDVPLSFHHRVPFDLAHSCRNMQEHTETPPFCWRAASGAGGRGVASLALAGAQEARLCSAARTDRALVQLTRDRKRVEARVGEFGRGGRTAATISRATAVAVPPPLRSLPCPPCGASPQPLFLLVPSLPGVRARAAPPQPRPGRERPRKLGRAPRGPDLAPISPPRPGRRDGQLRGGRAGVPDHPRVAARRRVGSAGAAGARGLPPAGGAARLQRPRAHGATSTGGRHERGGWLRATHASREAARAAERGGSQSGGAAEGGQRRSACRAGEGAGASGDGARATGAAGELPLPLPTRAAAATSSAPDPARRPLAPPPPLRARPRRSPPPPPPPAARPLPRAPRAALSPRGWPPA